MISIQVVHTNKACEIDVVRLVGHPMQMSNMDKMPAEWDRIERGLEAIGFTRIVDPRTGEVMYERKGE